eukprot:1969245-Rhodomonas_salina.1
MCVPCERQANAPGAQLTAGEVSQQQSTKFWSPCSVKVPHQNCCSPWLYVLECTEAVLAVKVHRL